MVESKDNFYLRDYLTNKKLFLQILTSRAIGNRPLKSPSLKGQPFGDAIVKRQEKF